MTIDEQAATQLINYLNSGLDFASQQAPLVADEILRWGMMSGAVLLVLGLICLAVIVKFFIPNLKEQRDQDGVWLTLFLFSIIPIIMICANTYTILQIWVAPRLYLLDYITHSVK